MLQDAEATMAEDYGCEDDARWRSVERRDAEADGHFWTCVRTTRIYCRPSCPARPHRKNVFFVDRRAEAEAAGYRPCKRCRPDRWVGGSIAERIRDIDWAQISDQLLDQGWSRLGAFLSAEECDALIEGYEEEEFYRSTVVMGRYGFGAGEYKYFGERPPKLVATLRERLYEKLVPAAHEWSERLGRDPVWPKKHRDLRQRCAESGQVRPTSLIVKYGPGDYNRLHRDLYGDLVFPYQVVILLSEPGEEFEGGELVLTEQRPRMQSRAEVVPLLRGEAVVIAVNDRPVQGAKRIYRGVMRHGVATVRSGSRYALGIIFHDAP